MFVTRSFGPEKPKVFNQNVAETAQHFTLRGRSVMGGGGMEKEPACSVQTLSHSDPWWHKSVFTASCGGLTALTKKKKNIMKSHRLGAVSICNHSDAYLLILFASYHFSVFLDIFSMRHPPPAPLSIAKPL